MNPNDASSSATREKSDRVVKLLSAIPYAQHLGACLHQGNDGPGLVLRLPFQPRLVGNTELKAFHGGVVGGFMQITALTTTCAELGEERPPRLIDFSIDFLSSAGPYDLYARCEFQRVGRRVAAVGIRCWQKDEGAPVAVARAHLYVAQAAPITPTLSSDFSGTP